MENIESGKMELANMLQKIIAGLLELKQNHLLTMEVLKKGLDSTDGLTFLWTLPNGTVSGDDYGLANYIVEVFLPEHKHLLNGTPKPYELIKLIVLEIDKVKVETID